MWLIIYFGLANLGFGMTVAVIIQRRTMWVLRMIEVGHDFQTTFPSLVPPSIRRLYHKPVDAKRLCLSIASSNMEVAPHGKATALKGNSQARGHHDEPATSDAPESRAVHSLDSHAVPTDLTGTVSDFETESTEPTNHRLEKLTVSDQSPDVSREDDFEDSSTMEVIDLQNDEDEVSSQSEATDQKADPLEFTEGQAHAKSASVQEQGSGDFLQRVTSIDGMLIHAIDSDDDEIDIVLIESLKQIQDATNYWAEFYQSTHSLMERVAQLPDKRGLCEQILGDLDDLKEEIASCQSLANHKLEQLTTQVSSTAQDQPLNSASAAKIRGRMLQACRQSHTLRDNLNFAISASPIGISLGHARPNLQNYFEGLPGLNSVLEAWQACQSPDDPEVAGIGIIDIDGFNNLNQHYGLAAGDQILVECCQGISGTMRHNRGFDRLIRISGQQFVMFYGHTMGPNVRFALERIRQMFTKAEFAYMDRSFQIRISAAAIEYDPALNGAQQLEVLRSGLQMAKRNGSDCVTVASAENQFSIVDDAPVYDLPGQSFKIEVPDLQMTYNSPASTM